MLFLPIVVFANIAWYFAIILYTKLNCKIRSGMEEEYSERDRLLQKVTDFMRESGHKIKPVKHLTKPLELLHGQQCEPAEPQLSPSSCVTATRSQSAHSLQPQAWMKPAMSCQQN